MGKVKLLPFTPCCMHREYNSYTYREASRNMRQLSMVDCVKDKECQYRRFSNISKRESGKLWSRNLKFEIKEKIATLVSRMFSTTIKHHKIIQNRVSTTHVAFHSIDSKPHSLTIFKQCVLHYLAHYLQNINIWKGFDSYQKLVFFAFWKSIDFNEILSKVDVHCRIASICLCPL